MNKNKIYLISAAVALILTLPIGLVIQARISNPNGLASVGSQWTTSGNNIYYNTGLVGIGTSTPFARLSVVGPNSLTQDAFVVASSTAGSPLLRVKGSNGDISFGNDGFLYEASSAISYIGGLETGSLSFPADAGIVMAMDMDIVSAAAFTEESYEFALGGNGMFKISNFTNTAGVLSTTSTVLGMNFQTANAWGDTSGIYNGLDSFWQGGTITTTNNTTTTLIAVPIQGATSTIAFDCEITAQGATSSARAGSYVMHGGVSREQGGVAAVLGTPVVDSFETANNPNSDVYIAVAGTQANIVVSGSAGTSINWSGSCRAHLLNQ